MREMQVAIPGKTKLQQGHIDQLNLRFDCVHNVPRAAIFYFLGWVRGVSPRAHHSQTKRDGVPTVLENLGDSDASKVWEK